MDKDFHRQKSKEHYQKYKSKYNARNQEQKARSRVIVREAKQEGCAKCDESEPACLDFHHVGDKDRTVSSMMGMSDTRLRDEIAKCVVLCANCHRKVHAGLITLGP